MSFSLKASELIAKYVPQDTIVKANMAGEKFATPFSAIKPFMDQSADQLANAESLISILASMYDDGGVYVLAVNENPVEHPDGFTYQQFTITLPDGHPVSFTLARVITENPYSFNGFRLVQGYYDSDGLYCEHLVFEVPIQAEDGQPQLIMEYDGENRVFAIPIPEDVSLAKIVIINDLGQEEEITVDEVIDAEKGKAESAWVLKCALDVALSDDPSVANFTARIGEKETFQDDTKAMIADIKNLYLTQGFSMNTVMEYVRSIDMRLSTAAEDVPSPSLSFNDRDYVVRNSFTPDFGQIFSTIGQIAGAIVTFVHPIIGAAVSAVSGIVGKITEVIKTNTTDLARFIDDVTANNSLAVPLIQGTYSNLDDVPLSVLNNIRRHGKMQIDFLGFSQIFWVSKSSREPDDEGYATVLEVSYEVYLNCNVTNVLTQPQTVRDQLRSYVLDTFNTQNVDADGWYNVNFAENSYTAFRALQAFASTGEGPGALRDASKPLQDRNRDALHVFAVTFFSLFSFLGGYVGLRLRSNANGFFQAIDRNTGLVYYEGSYSSDDDLLSRNPFTILWMIAKAVTSDDTDFRTSLDHCINWMALTNYGLIPFAEVTSIAPQYSGFGAMYLDLIADGNNVCNMMDEFADNCNFFILPPAYSTNATIYAIAFLATVVVVAVGVVIAKVAIGRARTKKLVDRKIKVQNQFDAYKANPTKANWKEYTKSVRSHNRLSKRMGGSVLAMGSTPFSGTNATMGAGTSDPASTFAGVLGTKEDSDRPEDQLTVDDKLNLILDYLYNQWRTRLE